VYYGGDRVSSAAVVGVVGQVALGGGNCIYGGGSEREGVYRQRTGAAARPRAAVRQC